MLSAPLSPILDPVCHDCTDQRLAPPPPPDAASGLFKRVDSTRLRLIHQLFPASTTTDGGGLVFLARLLALATPSCRAARDGEPEGAVIAVQSIRELARRIGWSYDTTHKYVVLFCALGLLFKRKRRGDGKVELAVAQGSYRPPRSLEALDRLIASSRPKVQSYARKVRHRYLHLYGEQMPAEEPGPAAIPELDECIRRIQHLIEREPSSAQREALIRALLAHLEQFRRKYAQGAGLHEGLSPVSAQASLPANGRRSARMPSTVPASGTDNGRLSSRTGDSAPMPQTSNGRLGEQTGDSAPMPQTSNGRLGEQTGDSAPMSQTSNGRLGGQTGDSAPMPQTSNGRLGEQTVDSVNVNNVNVSLESLVKDINVNVKGVTNFLLTVFHEAPSKRGYYYQLHRQYPRSECWLGATLETLVGMHQSKAVKNAGKHFYDRCVALHQCATLPPSTQALVAQYASLSYPQLLAALRSQPQQASASRSSTAAGQPDQYAVFIEQCRAKQRAWYEEYCRQHQQQPASTTPTGA